MTGNTDAEDLENARFNFPRAAGKIESVGVLPWLDLRDTVTIGDVSFYRADAVAPLLGDRADVLADRLAIYRDSLTGASVHGTVAIHRRQQEVGGEIPYDELRRAVDIFMVAAIFANDGSLRQQNATTFTLFIQKLGGEVGFMAVRTRRRNRGYINGTTTDQIVTRPPYAETYSSYNRQIAEALVSAAKTGDGAWRLFDALAWFRRASTDADNVEPIVDLVLLLTAVDFLLAHPATSGPGLDQTRIRALLEPYDTIPCCSVLKSRVERSHIETALYALNAVRNASLHPRQFADDETFGFQRAETASFPWIVDRCFMALLVARLIELGALSKTDAMEAFIAGVERWIQDATENVGLMVSKAKLDHAVRRAFREGYEREVTQVALTNAPDALRAEWQRDFAFAIGTIEPPWSFNVVWLANGAGVIEVYQDTARGPILREYFGFDPVDDSPAKMAYSALAYPENDAPPSHARALSENERRAMSELGLWIGGGSYPV